MYAVSYCVCGGADENTSKTSSMSLGNTTLAEAKGVNEFRRIFLAFLFHLFLATKSPVSCMLFVTLVSGHGRFPSID